MFENNLNVFNLWLFLGSMNNKAEEAIAKVKGPCVILAGAGTGKTHAIVEKIKYLIKNKIYNPERIVCITFSNEAANSLLARVQKSLDIGALKTL